MKKIVVYFKEDTQELKFLPIDEGNCFYLGDFSSWQIRDIWNLLDKGTFSFPQLIKAIKEEKI